MRACVLGGLSELDSWVPLEAGETARRRCLRTFLDHPPSRELEGARPSLPPGGYRARRGPPLGRPAGCADREIGRTPAPVDNHGKCVRRAACLGGTQDPRQRRRHRQLQALSNATIRPSEWRRLRMRDLRQGIFTCSGRRHRISQLERPVGQLRSRRPRNWPLVEQELAGPLFGAEHQLRLHPLRPRTWSKAGDESNAALRKRHRT